MLRKLVILSVSAGLSASVPLLYQNNPELLLALMRSATDATPGSRDIGAMSLSAPVRTAVTGRKVVLRADENGHFVGEFKLNGRRVTAMVDTGATLVAMNRSTARSIGISLAASDFKYQINTANGATRAASAVIASIDVGRIRLENVEGVVLEDVALSQTLIGMSFLRRLDKYQVEDGALLLAQ
jgi:aspartyl protease family protein